MFWLWFWEAWFERSAVWAVDAADPGDAEAFARLHAACFARGWDADEMEALLRDGAVCACALRREGRDGVFGFALSRIASCEAEVLSIAVDGARRRAGGGRALFARHLGRLAGMGVRRVVLEVDENNEAALALYAAFGFEQVGERKAYYAHADGRRGSAKVLARAMD